MDPSFLAEYFNGFLFITHTVDEVVDIVRTLNRIL